MRLTAKVQNAFSSVLAGYVNIDFREATGTFRTSLEAYLLRREDDEADHSSVVTATKHS